MNHSPSRPALRTRVSAGALVATALLSVTLGAAPSGAAQPPASAAPSAFCKTILAVPKNPPKTTNLKNYQAWAKQWLPYWQRAAAMAPNATIKKALNPLVGILKAEANYKSPVALGAYIASHQTQWSKGWVAFSKALIQCSFAQL